MIDTGTLWLVIVLLGAGSYGLRFVFVGLVGDRPLPGWLLRHLRYTAVALIPGLVAPLVVWPEATGGAPDPARMIAALVTIVAGLWLRNVLMAIGLGAASLFAGLYLLG